MTHTTLRPYTKILSIDSGETSAIELRDTSETLLECNYIRVNTSGVIEQTATVDFTVYLSGIPGLTTPGTPTTAATAEGSGFCGIAGQGDGIVPVEIFLDDQDRVSEIQIYNPAPIAVNYSITYGNIRFINPMRFNDRPKGS